MHIAFLAPIATEDLLSEAERQNIGSYPKGYEGAPLTSFLIKGYIARGHKVTAITTDVKMAIDSSPFIYQSGLLTFIIVPSRKHTFRFNDKLVGRAVDFYHYERKQIVNQLQKYKPDVVHAHWTYEFALAALEYDPKAIITIHDNPWVVLKYLRTVLRLVRFCMACYVFNKGKRFTTISPYMAKSVAGYISGDIVIIPNPLTTSFDTIKKSVSQRFIVAVMNGWDKRKNGERLLLAFNALQAKHPDIVLLAIGTAFEPGGKAEEFCRRQQIQNVRLLGKLPHKEVLNKISTSYILLHTSLEESFGMVLIEAMSFGVPVVAGKFSGAVPWVVDNGGILIDVTSVKAIFTAVDELLSDENLYATISCKATENVKFRFSLDSVLDQYIKIYEAEFAFE